MTAAERMALTRARRRAAAIDLTKRNGVFSTDNIVQVGDETNIAAADVACAPRAIRPVQDPDQLRAAQRHAAWKSATLRLQRMFFENDFGHTCSVCDRLWFARDLRLATSRIAGFLAEYFPHDDTSMFKLCDNCLKFCRKSKIPPLSRTNGYEYPPKPANLPKLDKITERLISPRIPYMQIRRLRRQGDYGIVGQVINVPVDVDTMVRALPRALDDDHAFNVNLKKHIIHKSPYINGSVKKSTVHAWLKFLVKQPLYRLYNIVYDWTVFNNSVTHGEPETSPEDFIETLDSNAASESELIQARQETMIWNEEQGLDIAPGQNRRPESLLMDTFAEELAFPSIYLGVGRKIQIGNSCSTRTPAYSMCMSEIRRTDRRGATPQHVLFMAMKILRFRVNDGVQNMYRCLRNTEKITRDMIEDRAFVERLLDTNQAFLKTIPNSVQYWAGRKRDLFAMIRQLGTPTAFLTVSANEINWPDLLRILHRLSEDSGTGGHELGRDEVFNRLNRDQRIHLVSEDPVTCAIYFNKLVHELMSILRTKQKHNPFGRHRVVDYFYRIEFQQRGSPHAHILLWLACDPAEDLSEDMPRTVQLINDLCSVHKQDLANPEMIRNQTHSHTFTCTKRGEQTCRFNIPYWPMYRTLMLLPLAKEDERRKSLRKRVREARSKLETKVYDTIESFLADMDCDFASYLNLIRSSLKRPTYFLQRDMSQLYINAFHPWIASMLNSNMDLQIILDPYSCAAYVVDYVNKSNRGISHLHHELTKIHEANPEYDQAQLMSRVGLKVLNGIEMSAQEAAWYLLRQPMSKASRATVSIPTMPPNERYRARKRTSALNAQNVPGDSTDIWTKTLIEKYEERPINLETTSLAEFAAWYGSSRNAASETEHPTSDEFIDAIIDANEIEGDLYTRRKLCKIIRYRNYDKTDIRNYKREMVMLHIPFRNELLDIIDRDKFLEIYAEHEQRIMKERERFEYRIDIEAIIREIEALCHLTEDVVPTDLLESEAVLSNCNGDLPDDDILRDAAITTVSAIKSRDNVLSKAEFCALMRKTNPEQRELILEVIHRLHMTVRVPIQIFLTGPAGCGKTFTLLVLMETYNRYTQEHNAMNNAYITTATTGKAAVPLNGVTVHAAFRLTISKQTHHLSSDVLHTYRHLLKNVRCVIIDEISMCSSHLFNAVNSRLQGMTGEYESPFGGMDFFACGDLRQLPPVNAAPVYAAPQGAIGGFPILWQSLDYFPLVRVVRQRNIEFSTLLTKIGSGQALTTREQHLIESRFRTRDWCRTNLPTEVIRLYFNNEDVENYNALCIPVTESTEIANASDVYSGFSTELQRENATKKVLTMKTKDTGSLPRNITLAKDFPYMVTVNVDVEDGIVNGAVGKLRYVEHCFTNREDNESKRVWLEFDTEYIGRRAKIRYGPHVRSKPGVLNERWVPIELRSVNINIPPNVKCRRIQFPLLPACAMTIHKSQGGTFNQIVYDYHKKHRQQLVYVALSRATSLDGLFLTNCTDDSTFYHTKALTSPSIKEVQNEYLRLGTHRLPTITAEIERFLSTSTEHEMSFTIVNVNVQSLAAHAEDISSDNLLSRADILALTETWMNNSTPPVQINGFELVHHVPCENRSGGVALFKRNDCTLRTTVLNDSGCHRSQTLRRGEPHRVDSATIKLSTANDDEFVLTTAYVHQRTKYEDLEAELSNRLKDFRMKNSTQQAKIPLILLGDFNISESERPKLEQYLEHDFGLKLQNDTSEKTTLGNTCIDLTFSRNTELQCKPFVAYFSYHRPVFNKICIKTNGITKSPHLNKRKQRKQPFQSTHKRRKFTTEKNMV